MRLLTSCVCVFCLCSIALSAASVCTVDQSTLQMAETALQNGKLEAADDLLTPLQQSEAECPVILLLLGRAKHAEGMPSLARDLLTRYTAAIPNDPQGFVALSKVLASRHDYQSAAEAANKAITLDAHNVPALLLLAQLDEQVGQLAHAESSLASAAAIVPPDRDARFQLGAFFDRRHRSAEAVITFQNYLKLDKSNPFAWDYLALNRESLGQAPEAEDAYKAGLAVNAAGSQDRFLDYNYGRFLMKANRLEESQSHLDRAVKVAPQTRAVYYERAKLHLLLQNIAAAQSDIKQALALPDAGQYVQDVQLYALAAVIASRRGDAEQAHKYAELAHASPLRNSAEGRQ